MKKKRTISTILTICAVVAFFFVVTFEYFSAGINNSTVLFSVLAADRNTNTITTSSDQFKILQITDTQFNNYILAGLSLPLAKRAILKAKPDMIVLTGDNTHNDSTKREYDLLVRFLDSFGIPWAAVLGNHEYSTALSFEDLCSVLSSGEHSLFQEGTIANSYGNYYYNVKKDDNIVFSLFFMDSAQDGFRAEHVAWYENAVNSITAENGGTVVPSFAFFHIPTIETKYAYDAYKLDSSIGSGEVHEEICYQSTNVGFFDKVVELGSTKALIYGHDHVNNMIVDWQGVKLCYGLKTGRTIYYRPGMLGGNLYTVNADGTFGIERIYVYL